MLRLMPTNPIPIVCRFASRAFRRAYQVRRPLCWLPRLKYSRAKSIVSAHRSDAEEVVADSLRGEDEVGVRPVLVERAYPHRAAVVAEEIRERAEVRAGEEERLGELVLEREVRT